MASGGGPQGHALLDFFLTGWCGRARSWAVFNIPALDARSTLELVPLRLAACLRSR